MFKSLLPTIIFILLAILVSIIVLNYFNINMADNSGLVVLNRTAVYEGMQCKDKKDIKK